MFDAPAPRAARVAPAQPSQAARHRDHIALARVRHGRSDASSGGDPPVESGARSNARTETGVAAETLAVEVIPPRQTTREAAALESGMAALAHELDHPIALELAGTPEARRFVARAADAAALDQVVRQLRARYPQAIIRPLPPDEDALRLAPGEAISALELCPGAAPYLPLRTPAERELAQEGADPLLGLVAAFSALGSGMRALAQLALAPARDGWSAPHQRLALEHPLEPERARERWELATARMDPAAGASGAELGLPAVVSLLALLGLVVLVHRNVSRFPGWLRADALALLHRHAVHLSSAQTLWLAAWAGGALAVLLAMLIASAWIRGRWRAWRHPTQLYDPQLVRDKTARVAYRARLRVLVIGPTPAPARPAPLQAPVLPRESRHHTAPCRGTSAGASSAAANGRGRDSAQVENFRRITAHLKALRTGARRRLRSTLLVRVVAGVRRRASSPSGCLRLVRRYGGIWLRARRRTWREQVRARNDAGEQARLRREVLEGFIGAYRQFHLATGAYFRPWWLSAHTARRITITAPHRQLGRRDATLSDWAYGLARSTHLLSVADVAALWHLPQASDLADLPFVERSRARTLLAPPALAHPPDGADAVRIGSSAHAGHALPVYLPPDATRRNALAIAKTGKGKSTLLLSLARAALAERDGGLVLIDPHGDLAETVLTLIPDHRRDDVLLVDLGDRAYPIGLNPLDVTLNPDRDKAVSNMIAVFSQIWKDFWGPRMESALEAALKTLHEANQAEMADDPQDGPDRQFTLLDATPLMTFAAFRHSLLGRVRDPALSEYWMRFEALQPRLQQDIITPVTTKLDKFAHSVVARRIVGQGRSTLDLAEAIQQGRVVLVETARGVVGHDTSALVGATLLGLLQVTVGEQAAMPAEQRQRVRVVVDEFQTLQGVDFGAMLSELRKYGASFALATQALAHLDALDRTLRPTVLANVDQLFAFAMSAEDARLVERELDGVVEATDLIALDDFACYARLSLDGRRLPVFSLALDPPPVPDVEARTLVDVLRRRSQKRIGRFVEQADTIIAHAAVRRRAIAEQHQQHQQQQQWGPYQYGRDTHSAYQRPSGGDRSHDRTPSTSPASSLPAAGMRAPAAGRTEGASEMSNTTGTSGTENSSGAASAGARPAFAANAKAGKRGSSHWSKKRRRANHGFDAMIVAPEDDGEEGDDEADDIDNTANVGETAPEIKDPMNAADDGDHGKGDQDDEEDEDTSGEEEDHQ